MEEKPYDTKCYLTWITINRNFYDVKKAHCSRKAADFSKILRKFVMKKKRGDRVWVSKQNCQKTEASFFCKKKVKIFTRNSTS